jgi:hypothetical protein
MAVTIDEARKVVMELSGEERQLLAEEMMQSRWDPAWAAAWTAEGERRNARIESGEDRELTLEEFWSDEARD